MDTASSVTIAHYIIIRKFHVYCLREQNWVALLSVINYLVTEVLAFFSLESE